MRPIERRIAALEGRQGLQARPIRIVTCPDDVEVEDFRRKCEAEHSGCDLRIIHFVKPGWALHQQEGNVDALH